MRTRFRDFITIDSILDEVERVRNLALDEHDYQTALNCTLSKAKLMGVGSEIQQQEKRHRDSLSHMLD
ncbi:hypothetical protein [Psychrobacter sanguinis]|mgnify:CR=1 FL=1|uniref:hypothetical protein n=2 Tax=Psychrobacter sanguinis TaxID=861445 RepID=UPI0019180A10|nr:hypothetical protein [Psychrobacter sanguinis]MCC3308583.1 hypothetical protein [Psychrobacter sanguinis]MCC3346143.1 hypothetical protein [Psychrobacter sanguinis]MDY3305309.1 hypothetical protein [Psychrobacter sanguinis]